MDPVRLGGAGLRSAPAGQARSAGCPSYEEWMPAVAVFHPSCSRGLRRAIALLRKPAGIDRREAVETSRRSPPSQNAVRDRRPQVRTAGQRPAGGPSLRGFTAARLGTPASAGTAARRAAAAHRCPDSRRRGLERRLPAGTARHRRTESHKAGGAQTREPLEPPLPRTAMRRITPLSKLAQCSSRPTLNQGRSTLISGLISGVGDSQVRSITAELRSISGVGDSSSGR